ncbi:hypothetical protein [Acidicapsa ligni]|uniref:hypothetical protein n=1 Tax=Acidicapsa ligni TaxID=542300 RepID=UPI0021DFCF76|nr:hypothetical protein [Acidicapsa ligni]
MGRTFSNLIILLFVSFVVFDPRIAKADIAYTFIKMTCDPISQSVSLRSFYDWDTSGKERTISPGEGVYPLGERTGQKTQTKGTCALGEDQVFSFVADQAALPKNDGINLFINGQKLERGFTLNDEWVMKVHQEAANAYSIKFCPNAISSLSTLSVKKYEEIQHEGKALCDFLEVNNRGFIVKAETIDLDPAQ